MEKWLVSSAVRRSRMGGGKHFVNNFQVSGCSWFCFGSKRAWFNGCRRASVIQGQKGGDLELRGHTVLSRQVVEQRVLVA